MESENNFMEKRRYGRLASRVEIQYRKIGETPHSPVGSLAYDISGGGVKLLAHEFVPMGTKLRVGIPLEYPMKMINAVGRVVWVQKRPYTEQYDLGLEFLDINSEDQNDLVNYVEKTLVRANMM